MKHFIRFIFVCVIALTALAVKASNVGGGDTKPGQNKLGVTEIYPNPANNVVHADYTFPANVRQAKVVIYNVLGTKIDEVELNRTEKQVAVNTTDLAGGIYIFTVSVDGVTEFSKRLIVKH